jgi:hypothetical protein
MLPIPGEVLPTAFIKAFIELTRYFEYEDCFTLN